MVWCVIIIADTLILLMNVYSMNSGRTRKPLGENENFVTKGDH